MAETIPTDTPIPRKRQIRVDESERDAEFVKTLYDRTQNLCALVEEMFEEHKTTLLSPVFRRMVLDQARTVKRNLNTAMYKLHVDNPGITDMLWKE